MTTITLQVTTNVDQNDGTDQDGLSLRDAIIQANSDTTNDYVIELEGGKTYVLNIDGSDEDASLTGDLDIASGGSTTIKAVGTNKATITGAGFLQGDRIFDILGSAIVNLDNVVVTGGNSYGGIDNDGNLTITNSTITGNKAFNTGGVNNNGNLTIINSTISGNSADNYHGGLANGGTGNMTIINSTISGNTSSNLVGGIVNYGNLSVINSTISGNKASDRSGGFWIGDTGKTFVLNSTITANVAGSTGDGIYVVSGGSISLRNTIVAGNSNNDISGTVTGNANNLIGSLSGASGTIGTGSDIVNPNVKLGPLKNNGGATFTHALLPGSPAINAGNNILVPADSFDIDGDGNLTEFLPLDQRGVGFKRSVGRVDIGAFEYQSPLITISDVSIAEGNSGVKKANFIVKLSSSSSNNITVAYNTSNISGTAPSDYLNTTGILTFTPGTINKTIQVTIKGDTLIEPNETFKVNLSNATNATIIDSQGIGTITNDDAKPKLSINDLSLSEGNTGTKNAIFTVTLSGKAANTVTVNYGTANGTALSGIDYIAKTGVVSFPVSNATTQTKTIQVPVKGDTVFEVNETLKVNLSNATNATIIDNQAIGTIINDDIPPKLSINDLSLSEGNTGTKLATLTVTLTGRAANNVTVNYGTANGTALSGIDYIAKSGVLSFPVSNATTQTKTIQVPVKGDTVFEPNETFKLNLSNATNATIIDNQAIGTITNDDAKPKLSINNLSILEGNSGTKLANLTVTLTGRASNTVTVNYSTANGTALSGSDYIAKTGVVSFASSTLNTQTKTIQVAIKGDTLLEGNENFYVNLSNATNADFTTNKGTITIKNDDVLTNNRLFQSSNNSIDISTALGVSVIEKVDRGITQSIFGDLVVADGLVS